MVWLDHLDRLTLPLRRWIAERRAPDPASLGHPLFSARVKDRLHRWRTLKQPNAYAAIASKLGGAEYMQSLGHEVPKLYGTYDSLANIPPFEDLPSSFVVKPMTGWKSTGVFLMRDGYEAFRKRHLSRKELIEMARASAGGRQKQPNGTWIVEELLLNHDGSGEPAWDFKFYCFGPKVVVIQIVRRTGRKASETRHWFRDPDWRPLPFQLSWDRPSSHAPLARPDCLDDMLRIVSDVGARLNIFLRIDMYATDRGPVFGEFTAYPNMGNGLTPRGDAWLGSHWKTLDGGIPAEAG